MIAIWKIIVNKELFLDILSVSVVSSIISSQAIQKIKETFNFGVTFNKIISIFLSFGIGFCYSLSFYTANILYAVWIGIFTLIGAEGLYKTFKGYFGLTSSNDNISKWYRIYFIGGQYNKKWNISIKYVFMQYVRTKKCL